MHHPFSGHHLALCVVCCLTFAGHLVVSLRVFCDVIYGVRVTMFECIVLLEAAQNPNKKKQENGCCSRQITVALQRVRHDDFLFFFSFFG